MTPSRSLANALSSKPDAAASDKEIALSFKSTPAKRTSSKQENMNLNCLSNNKDKNPSPEAASWASLPASLLKPGKVPCLDYSSTFCFLIAIFRKLVIWLPFHLSDWPFSG